MPVNITDEEILEDILSSRIVYQNGGVFMYDASRHKYILRKPKIMKGRRYYEISKGGRGKRRKSSMSGAKLIWMTYNRSLVPPGKDVEHRDGDRTNDYPSNLILRDSGSNRSENNGHTMTRAYWAGQEASFGGEGPDANPYPINTDRWHDWERGFLQAPIVEEL
jgi:hypothetical protein